MTPSCDGWPHAGPSALEENHRADRNPGVVDFVARHKHAFNQEERIRRPPPVAADRGRKRLGAIGPPTE
jgi:hypothetical protein